MSLLTPLLLFQNTHNFRIFVARPTMFNILLVIIIKWHTYTYVAYLYTSGLLSAYLYISGILIKWHTYNFSGKKQLEQDFMSF